MAEQGNYTATNLPNDGDTIDAADVNTDLQGLIDEFNKEVGESKIADGAVSATKIKSETWTSWTPTWSGFSASPTVAAAVYRQLGTLVTCSITLSANGTSNATTLTVTLPVAAKRTQVHLWGTGVDNSAAITTPGGLQTVAGSTTANVYKSIPTGAWTNSGEKSVQFTITYEAV